MRGISPDRAEFIRRNQSIMAKVYAAAKSTPNQWCTISPSAPLDSAFSKDGLTQHSFLLPNLAMLRAAIGIGLPCPCREPVLGRIKYLSGNRAFWLEISAKASDGRVVQRFLLISEELGGKAAILKALSPTQRVLFELYDLAKRAQGQTLSLINHKFPAPINSAGATMNSFLLPCGSSVGQGISLGLGHSPKNVRPVSIMHDHNGTVWWEFKSEDRASFVGIDESMCGPKAVKWVFSPPQKRLHQLYDATSCSEGFITQQVDITDFIGSHNRLKATWLLANNVSRGSVSPIGLPKEARYSSATVMASKRNAEACIALAIRLQDHASNIQDLGIEVNCAGVKRIW